MACPHQILLADFSEQRVNGSYTLQEKREVGWTGTW